MSTKIHATAMIEDGVEIGPGTSIWDNVHIRSNTRIGSDCIVGEKTYIAYGVNIGHGVMISAATVFTNDRFPRAATTDLRQLRPSDPDEHTLPTLVREGATIGANCTIGNDLTIGRFAMVGMASVVTKSVPEFHLVIGQPARSIGCVCRCGQLLKRFDSRDEQLHTRETCSACGLEYLISTDQVTELNPPL